MSEKLQRLANGSVRCEVVFNRAAYSELERLVRRTGVHGPKDLINEALSLYQAVVTGIEKGATLCWDAPGSDDLIEIKMAVLERIKDSAANDPKERF
jgi:hypothetical protein